MKSTTPYKKPQPEPGTALKLIQVKVPPKMLEAVDKAVTQQDTDRSKFLRQAIRTALSLIA